MSIQSPTATRGPFRVAVTGIGVVSTAGIGIDAFFDGICGRRETAPVFDGIVGRDRDGSGQRNSTMVPDWDPSAYFETPKEARRTDRFEQFAVAAATEAMAMAGTLSSAPERTGIVLGTGLGGLRTYEQQQANYLARGERGVSPLTVPMVMPNAASSVLSRRWGFTGPCETVSVACASGTHAIGSAWRLISWGVCDAMLAGGAESAGAPSATGAFYRMGALSNVGISRPFDVDRDGFIMSEGAAVLVLERWDLALDRGATPLAELVGFAANADAYHIAAPSPDGRGAADCMRQAIAAGGLEPADIRHVNAHGTSTPMNDPIESMAISSVFGGGAVPVTSIKGATGHAIGAAGAIEAVSVVLSIARRTLPPTLHTATVADDIDVDLVIGDTRPWEPGPVVSNSFAFGGHNASIVLSPA